MVTCVNLVKACAVFLKPFIPNLISKIEKQYGIMLKWEDYRFSLRGGTMGKTEKIVVPIENKEFDVLFGELKGDTMKQDEKEAQYIDFEEFKKMDLRIGIIKTAERIKKSNKLLKLTVDIGTETKQVVGGIAEVYKPEELIGRQAVLVVNLKPATLMGQKSEGMILAAVNGKKISLIQPDTDMPAGTPVS